MKIQQEIQQIKDKIHLSVAALLDRSLLTVSLQFAYKSSSMSFVWKTDDVIACVCCLHNVNAAKMFWQSHAMSLQLSCKSPLPSSSLLSLWKTDVIVYLLSFPLSRLSMSPCFDNVNVSPPGSRPWEQCFLCCPQRSPPFKFVWNIFQDLKLLLPLPPCPGPSSWAQPLGWRWGSRGRGERAGSALFPAQP